MATTNWTETKKCAFTWMRCKKVTGEAVVRGLVPRIHVLLCWRGGKKDVDARDKGVQSTPFFERLFARITAEKPALISSAHSRASGNPGQIERPRLPALGSRFRGDERRQAASRQEAA
jgi:hypothetical protein